jgi:hypothetical protein
MSLGDSWYWLKLAWLYRDDPSQRASMLRAAWRWLFL